MSFLTTINTYIDNHQNLFVQRLSDAVAIPSVSSSPDHSGDVQTMIDLIADQLNTMQFNVQLKEVGTGMPPVIFAKSPNYDNTKKTVCIYGHLDVQPAKQEDGWDTDPFVLTEIDGKMYGRGSSDNKGPVLGWLHCVEAYQNCNVTLPVNIKFVFEAQEESGSSGLADLIMAEKDKFLRDVDYVCISDNYWLGKTKPCITYGLRGICYFQCAVECSTKDLHSGVYGGSVYEAMSDLIAIMNSLVDKDGKILVPGIGNNVAPLTQEELELYQTIDFDLEEYKTEVGTTALLHPTKVGTLTHRWRFPSLSLHGIEGAFYEAGEKTVIPRKVIGKFSIRIVPNQTVAEVEKLVISHVNRVFTARGSPNKMTIECSTGGEPWVADYRHPHYQAGVKATETVVGTTPDMTREGGSIPVTLTFQEATGKSVMLLPIGASDDGAHSQNEKMNRTNYITGTKLLAAYLHEVSQLRTDVTQKKAMHHQQRRKR